MKRTALTQTLILILLILEISGATIAFGEVNPQQLLSRIMSFEEAIEFANMKNLSREQLFSYNLTGEPMSQVFVDGEGISGFLMWLAPNGTLYKAVYPNGIVLGEIGNTIGECIWNPPDGYYLWNIYNGEKLWMEKYSIFANNGTIALHTPP